MGLRTRLNLSYAFESWVGFLQVEMEQEEKRGGER